MPKVTTAKMLDNLASSWESFDLTDSIGEVSEGKAVNADAVRLVATPPVQGAIPVAKTDANFEKFVLLTHKGEPLEMPSADAKVIATKLVRGLNDTMPERGESEHYRWSAGTLASGKPGVYRVGIRLRLLNDQELAEAKERAAQARAGRTAAVPADQATA